MTSQRWHAGRASRRTSRLSHCSSMLVIVAALAGCSADSQPDGVTRSRISDPAGDVVVSGLGKDREIVSAAPGNTITDIVSTTVDHGSDVVTIHVAFKDLRPRQYLDLTAYVTTDSTGSRLPTQATALTYLGDSSIDVYGAGGSRCSAATVDIDYDVDPLTMSVPRQCLGQPRWIEAEVRAATMRYGEATIGPRGDAVWEDHAYRTGQEPAGGETHARLHHP
ncbi:hypothetical protein [Nocardioides xinjiangensis]|uniref:hypothetical protein n=1 Tax=Nocardioides xinjiangensis TaxID=2817376 RepID=UPI001B306A6E|nr:hypothetical protein [Nocardioides sp. SYSU D00514]